MHIALVRNLSPALEENVRSAFCAQVGGFICPRRCQTTSQRLLTFGGLNKDFFYQHAKKIYPWKKNGAFYLFIYSTFFFFPGTSHKSEGQAKKEKKENNTEEQKDAEAASFNSFAFLPLIKRQWIRRESFPPGVAHGRLPQT